MAINSLSSSSHGLSGLVSGMDTQSMVDAMLKGTQTKIDKTKSKKAVLTYQQEMYRSVSAQLRSLKNSFFSFGGSGSATNLYSSSFFNTMSSKTSSNAFKVTAGDGALTGDMKIDYIKALARASSKKSVSEATAALSGIFDANGLQKAKDAVKMSLNIKVGDTSVEIADLNALIAGKGNVEATEILNAKFAELFAGTGKAVKANYEDGSITFTATNNGAAENLTLSGTGTKVFGGGTLTSGSDGVMKQKISTSVLDPSMTVTLNNVKKTITFDYNSQNIGDVKASLQKSLDKAFGPEIEVSDLNGKFTFKTRSQSSQLMLQGDKNVMQMLGIKTGQSNKINTNMNAKDINFKTELVGENFSFEINGTQFNMTAGRPLSDIIAEINNSDAGVKITYSSSDDKFLMESKQSGAGVGITMSQSEGNLLSAMFGNDAVAGSGAVRGEALTNHVSITGTYDANGFMRVPDPDNPGSTKPFTGGAFVMGVNGTNYGYTLKQIPELDADGNEMMDSNGKPIYKEYTAEMFKTEMNTQLEKQFGKTDAGTANVSFAIQQDASGNDILQLNSERGYEVKFNDARSAKMIGVTEGAATTSAATGSSKLSDLGIGDDFAMDLTIGGQNIRLTLADFGGANATVDSMKTAINSALRAAEATAQPPLAADESYGTVDFEVPPGRFKMFGVSIPMGIVDMKISGKGSEQIFAGNNITFGDGQMSTDPSKFITTDGQNAVLSINGVEVQRNTNSFNYDGLNLELLTTTQKMDADGNPIEDRYDSGTITTTRDTEKIYNGLTKFVEEYNKVMETINGLMNADATYKDYPPLTSDQRSQMSESEAKLWDEKSHEGLLRRDPALEKVMSDLRAVLYTKPGDSDMALYNIGIKTYMSYEKNDAGKLELDNGGLTLKNMINERPDDVAKLFLSMEGGISQGIMNAIDKASKTTPGSEGSLVRIAGATGSPDTSSSIYKQLKGLNESLDTLERTYTMEYNRYWRQFSAMEQQIQQMNSQSSWLTQQFQ